MAMRTAIKNILDLVTHPLGLNIERHFGTNLGLKQILNIFKQQRIDMLLDVGANTGQYAMSMLRLGYKGTIISFEPLNGIYDILKTNQSKYNNWRVYERVAVGDYCGTTTINISENRESNSILPISETHTKVAPAAKYIGNQEISIITLDSVFRDIVGPANKICLKIDTQGFEDRVLAGTAESLKKITLIQLELSLIPLYHGSKTFEWMLPYLKELGFEPVLFLPGFIDRTTEEMQQIEGLFINKYTE
jgi:FkbM family methyltransferase